MGDPLIGFQISKRYPGFSLECEAGFEAGITAVFGPSGSGKTTLLNCIAGLDTPDAGEITVLGEAIYSSRARKNMPPEKRRFGYVFQDPALFPHLTVWDNIRYGYRLTPVDQRKIEPEQLVELFRIEHLVDRSVANLSGGERQRVVLARALATSPRLLLLDEPLASLDAGFRGVILRYLNRVWRELKTPMVLVSHSMSEVVALARDVLVLSHGRAVVQGSPSQVLVHPELTAIADYPTLENLLEAEVLPRADGAGPTQVAVGSVRLTVPEVNANEGDSVTVSIRAGDILLALDEPSNISAQNILRGTVEEVHGVGAQVLVYVDVGARLVVEITPSSLHDLGIGTGKDVYVIIKSTSILVLDAPDRATERG